LFRRPALDFGLHPDSLLESVPMVDIAGRPSEGGSSTDRDATPLSTVVNILTAQPPLSIQKSFAIIQRQFFCHHTNSGGQPSLRSSLVKGELEKFDGETWKLFGLHLHSGSMSV
jgi:hypothetical protein